MLFRSKMILLLVSIFLTQNLFADEEMVKVTSIRKGVHATVGGEKIIPKMDDELPLNAKVQCDKMGLLEIEYKGNVYKVEKNTTILISDLIKAGGQKNFQPELKTNTAGVRGLDEEKKSKKSRKNKKTDK